MSVLLRNVHSMVLDPSDATVVNNRSVLIEGNRIKGVFESQGLPLADRVIDGSRLVILPGFINTHHHLYQTMTRALPGAQDVELYEWLRLLRPIWSAMEEADVACAVRVGMAELLLSGVTTTLDQRPSLPMVGPINLEFLIARDLGLRFVGAWGGPDLTGAVKQDLNSWLTEALSLVRQFHDKSDASMSRVALGPSNLHSLGTSLAVELSEFARTHGVALHTHLGETRAETPLYRELYGCSPLSFAELTGWTGADTHYGHGIHFSDDELQRIAASRTGIAHCPSSNMRLGSGVIRLGEIMRRGIRLGIGVDGAASNEAMNFLVELRQALLLQRAVSGPNAVSARQVIELGSLGGARALGFHSLGTIARGAPADLIGYDLDRRELSGQLDPIALIIFGSICTVDLSIINGQVRIQGGELVDLDLDEHISELNSRTQALLRRLR